MDFLPWHRLPEHVGSIYPGGGGRGWLGGVHVCARALEQKGEPGQLDPGPQEPLASGASDVGSPPGLSSLLSVPILLHLLLLGLKCWWLEDDKPTASSLGIGTQGGDKG